MSFRCPIYDCQFYDRVTVRKGEHDLYDTEFFTCLGCSVMFLEPELLTLAPDFKRTARADNPQMCHEVAALHQARLYRFWEARATRENGGMTPKLEQILRLRSRYRR
jgi:hypothetical protein